MLLTIFLLGRKNGRGIRGWSWFVRRTRVRRRRRRRTPGAHRARKSRQCRQPLLSASAAHTRSQPARGGSARCLRAARPPVSAAGAVFAGSGAVRAVGCLSHWGCSPVEQPVDFAARERLPPREDLLHHAPHPARHERDLPRAAPRRGEAAPPPLRGWRLFRERTGVSERLLFPKPL